MSHLKFAQLLQDIGLDKNGPALDELAHALYGPLSLKEASRKGKMLYKKLNPFDNTANLAAIDLPAFIEATNNNAPIEFLANSRNLVVYPLPVCNVNSTMLDQRMSNTMTHFADVFKKYTQARNPNGDGGIAITKKEAPPMREATLNLLTELTAFLGALDKEVEN